MEYTKSMASAAFSCMQYLLIMFRDVKPVLFCRLTPDSGNKRRQDAS